MRRMDVALHEKINKFFNLNSHAMEKWIERYTLAKQERDQAHLSFRRSRTTCTLLYPPELVLLPDFPTNKWLEQTILQAKRNGESISESLHMVAIFM
mgnify:FL=1